MLHIFCFLFFVTSTLSFEPRIINGEDAKVGQFPWQVAVASVFPDWTTQLCSGAIIAPKWILTTAQCVNGALNVVIRAGNINFQNGDLVLDIASKIIVHEYFDNSTFRNDIALLLLTNRFSFNEKIKSINLAEGELAAGVTATVSGWGQSDRGTSGNLQYTTVSTIENIECERIYGYMAVTPGVVCTASSDNIIRNPCVGDGGAPLVIDVDTDPVLVALFSFIGSPGCEEGLPAGYTRVAYYTDWIKEKMAE